MSVIGDELRRELRDPEYSEGYADSFLNAYVATQTKVVREQRGYTQTELARLMGTTQTAISRIENVNYSAWNIKTLKKIARALNVRLKVSFETYGSLPDEVMSFDRKYLERDARENDPGLWDETSIGNILELVAGGQQNVWSLTDAARAYASIDSGTNVASVGLKNSLIAEEAAREVYGANLGDLLKLLETSDNEMKIASPEKKVVSGNVFRRRRAALRRKQRYARSGTRTARGTEVTSNSSYPSPRLHNAVCE